MILIKNAKIVSEKEECLRDVLLENLHVSTIAANIEGKEGVRVIDAKGAYLLPGIVDLNVRLANSELNEKSLEKLTKTSLAGGVCTSVIMPDFTPRLDSSTLLEHFKIKADMEDANLLVAAPLMRDDEERLNNVATLLNNGASALWTTSSCNSNLLKRGAQYASMKNKPIFCSCYDPNLDDNGVMNEGKVSAKLGLSGISKLSENAEVAKVAEIASEFGVTIVFQKLSTKRAIDIISSVEKKNAKMYKEVSVHHLIKNDTACDGFNTYAKIKPPLRDENERLLLLEELKRGNIDILTSAHSPKSVVYKDVAFEDAAFGIGAIEEYLCLAYTFLIRQNVITMRELVKLISTMPAQILGLENRGELKEGCIADLILFDPQSSKIIHSKTSIYNNDEIFGSIKYVFVDGNIVQSN